MRSGAHTGHGPSAGRRPRVAPTHDWSYIRWMTRPGVRPVPLLAATLAALGAAPAGGQVAVTGMDTTEVHADSTDLASVARAAQARFERRRMNHLPVTLSAGGGDCDEHVGRFCTWYGEGEWVQQPEAEEILALRGELLATLDSLQGHLPGDGWLLGQRVWYRAEGGDWPAARRVAHACGGVEPWWCAALEGFALHGLGRFVEAERIFERALAHMDPDRADEWRAPRRVVDGEGRDRLDDDARAGRGDSTRDALDRFWTLADPLWMVPGNDRLTAHYARWTVSTLREHARNPFHIRWGQDLEELTVRHGWELGWERSPDWTRRSTLDHIIGHKHPQGRDFMPPGDVLAAPESATVEDLVAGRRSPRSLYAPEYAPVFLPMDAQLAVFPRGAETVVVAAFFLPDDTTWHAHHDHDVPWGEPGDQAGMPDRIGLYAMPVPGGPPRGTSALGRADGTLALSVPTGPVVVSAEAWSPERRRAGRLRLGLPARSAPEDVATLSDLLLLAPMAEEPIALEGALDSALPRARILPGQTFAIGWEVAGLGFRAEGLEFEVSVERDGRGVLRRLGEALGLADRPQPLALSWEEPGPLEPGPRFHYLELDLPRLDPGDYRIRLVLRTAGRSDAVSVRDFEVRAREGG